MKPRILIVGTVPYNKKSTSRAFESYFKSWDSKSLAQVYSNSLPPSKGHCHTFFQITDFAMLKRWFSSKTRTGIVYHEHELDHLGNNSLASNNLLKKILYKIGSEKNSIIYILRKHLWKKKFWCTDDFEKWIENFNPECIFLSFSDDFFILEIALYVSKKFNIPIVSSIGDDYYFNFKTKSSPLYNYYKKMYRLLVREIFEHHKKAIFIGDKIRDKYNAEFNLEGRTIFLSSEIDTREFRKIDCNNPTISYFGNIRLGRNESLLDIANALSEIDKRYLIRVYSNEENRKYYNSLAKCNNIHYCGSISYDKVVSETLNSDLLLIVEGFANKDIDITRYSLSTKVADSLASGVSVFAYGSIDCGAIEYCQSTDAIHTCTSKKDLKSKLEELICNIDLQKKYFDKSVQITELNHNLFKSNSIFEEIINDLIKEFKNVKE